MEMMSNLNRYGFQEVRQQELEETKGGLFPIVIAGVTITAKTVGYVLGGAAAVGLFGVGVYHGWQSYK